MKPETGAVQLLRWILGFMVFLRAGQFGPEEMVL